MSLIFLTGASFNQLTLGTVTSNTSWSTLFPLVNVYDGRPGKPAMALDTTFVGTGLTIVCDGNHKDNTNGGFVSTSSGWSSSIATTGTLTIATSSANPHAGSWALVFNATSSDAEGTAYWSTALEVPSGSVWNIEAYVAGLAVSLGVWVENLDTGMYWNGTTWVAGSTGKPINFDYSASTSYQRLYSTFTVETFAETGKDVVRLRLGARREASTGVTGLGYLDDVALWPKTNFVSVHSHNFPQLNSTEQGALIVEASSDNFTTNHRQGVVDSTLLNSYVYLGHGTIFQNYRYQRIRAGVTLIYGGSTGQVYDSPLRFGEVVFGQAISFDEEPLHEAVTPWRINYQRPQTRGMNIGGATISAYPYTQESVRTVTIPYRINTSTGYSDFVEEMLERSGQGLYPVVLVPDTDKTDVVYARLKPEHEFSLFNVDAYDTQLEVHEEPGPVWMTS